MAATISGYDAHGNISGLTRTAGAVRHNFTAANAYQYTANSNKLSRIPTYALYSYDADGQMTAQQKDIATSPLLNQYVEYDGAGMVVAVYSDAAKTQKKVSYAYDEGGLRVKKVNHVTNITTYYVNGVIYDNEATAGGVIAQKEIPLRGGGRIGIYRVVENQYTYELSDHLGNVRAVISGTKVNGRADVLEYSDYYSIGGVARSGGTMRYRYGYQGQYSERDKETEWNSFDLRQYDPVVGRWLSPDPYAQYDSPYMGMGNDWAMQVDPDGGYSGVGTLLRNIASALGMGHWSATRNVFFFTGVQLSLNISTSAGLSMAAGAARGVMNGLQQESQWKDLDKATLHQHVEDNYKRMDGSPWSQGSLDDTAGSIFEETFHNWMESDPRNTYVANTTKEKILGVEPDGFSTGFVGRRNILGGVYRAAYPRAVWYEIKQKKGNVTIGYKQIKQEIDALYTSEEPARLSGATAYHLVTTSDGRLSPGERGSIAAYAASKQIRFSHIISQYKMTERGMQVRFITKFGLGTGLQHKKGGVFIASPARAGIIPK